MLTIVNLQKEIIDIISTISKLPPEKIHENSDILELGLDSLSWLDVLSAVEKRFFIQIPDDQLSEMRKVKDIVHIVEKLLKS